MPAVKLPKVVLSTVAVLAVSAARGCACASRRRRLASSPGHGYWLEAHPESLDEAALREALARSAFAGAPGAGGGARRACPRRIPGTVASGLAQLAAGWALVDAGKERRGGPLPHATRTSRRPPSRARRCSPSAAPSSPRLPRRRPPPTSQPPRPIRTDPRRAPRCLRAADVVGEGDQGAKAVAVPRARACPCARARSRGCSCAGPKCRTARGDDTGRGGALRPSRPRVPRVASGQGRRASPEGPRPAPARRAGRRSARPPDPSRRGPAGGRAERRLRSRPSAPRSRRRPTGDELDLVRVRLAKALVRDRPGARGRDPARRHRQRLAPRGRGRVPPRPRTRATRWPGAVRDGGRALPGHGLERRGPAPAREQLAEGRPRRRGGALLSPAAQGQPERPLPRARHLAGGLLRPPRRRATRTPRPSSRTRPGAGSRVSRRRASSTGPAGPAPPRDKLERARSSLRRDRAPLQAQLPRPAGARGPGPAPAAARERGAGSFAACTRAHAPMWPSPCARVSASSCSSTGSTKRATSCGRSPPPRLDRPPSPGSSGAEAACATRSSR